MNDLSGFNYFMVTAKFILKGFEFSGEINTDTEEWTNFCTGRKFIIKKSYDYLQKDELSSVLNQAGVSIDEFMDI